jgi:hypothetical protein
LILLFACSVPAGALFVIVVRATVRQRAAHRRRHRLAVAMPGARAVSPSAVGLALALTIGLGPHELGLRATYAIFMFAYMLLLGSVSCRGVLLGTGRYRPVGVGGNRRPSCVATFAIAGLGAASAAHCRDHPRQVRLHGRPSSPRRERSAAAAVSLDIRWTSLARPLLALGGLWALVASRSCSRTGTSRWHQVTGARPKPPLRASCSSSLSSPKRSWSWRSPPRSAVGSRQARCGAPSGLPWPRDRGRGRGIGGMQALGLRACSRSAPASVALVLTVEVASCAVGLLTILIAYCLVRGLPCAGTVWGAVVVMVAVAWLCCPRLPRRS